ncbi:exosortase C-terminal domain/associated protein EpsI [Thermodesulfobacteriota bacterium]
MNSMARKKLAFDSVFIFNVLLIVCAIIVVLWIQHIPVGSSVSKKKNISQKINNWQGQDIELDKAAFNILQPDYYVFRNYSKEGRDSINVFIGYYNSIDKSDLAHSPLVCYPGGGWSMNKQDDYEVIIKDHKYAFSRLLVEKGETKNLVLYGYKTSNIITGSLLKLRINLFYNKLFKQDEQSAFIRFSTPIDSDDYSQDLKLLEEFIVIFNEELDQYFSMER